MGRILILIALICMLASCRSTKKINTAIAKKDTAVTVIMPPKPSVDDSKHKDSLTFMASTATLMRSNYAQYQSFSSKLNIDYSGGDGKKYNVNGTLRMIKDSVLWVSVNAILGAEAMRLLITKDSVKLINRLENEYTLRSISYLQELTQLPLDLHTLQEIIIGNPVFFEEKNIVSYARTGDNIAMLAMGSFFKNLLVVNKEYRIQNSKLDDANPARSRTCNLTYEEYEDKKGFAFSNRRMITVAEKGTLNLKLLFKNYELNSSLNFPFTIPRNFKRN